MKKLKVLLVGLLVVALSGCTPASEGTTVEKADGSASESSQAVSASVGIVLAPGGLGDKNFNDMAYDGLSQAKEELGIAFDYVEPKVVSDYVSHFRMFAETGEYDLILGVGADQADAIAEVAVEFPEQKFSLVDSAADLPGVKTIYTDWTHQTFLCGVIAGLETQASNLDQTNAENVVGVVLGKEYPILMEGVTGFMAGVKFVNPEAEVLQATVGAFNDPAKGKEIALSMYNRGADFIQHIAGASGLGVFNAAKEADRYAFGVGGNQNHNAPDHIVATSIRNVNEMVYNEVDLMLKGEWVAGPSGSGLKEGSVGYSVEGSNIVLSERTIEIVEQAKMMILNDELQPCRNIDELDEWVKNNQYVQ
ncbi:BMP family ABC transporter substrate-binding protein [Gottschalkiaceae bacterium SANA]|nr:BMP family ABC transporter substrate-binding protein [Gottschalkiaceae bacterium SANA]